MLHLKIFHRHGQHTTPCPIPYCDQSERTEQLIKVFRDALATVVDDSELVNHINDKSGLVDKYMIATVGSSTFLVVSGKHGNIILEGLVQKLDTLKKASAFALAKMDVDEKLLPKMLRKSLREMKEFLRRK